MEGPARDIVHGVRNLLRAPVFTAVAAMSLALGVGANVLVFDLIDVLFLRPLPFPDSDRLVVIWTALEERGGQRGTSSVSSYYALRDRATSSFESIGAFNGAACGVRALGPAEDGAPAERLSGQTFSPSLFGTLGVTAQLGRTLVDGEDLVDDTAPVALISHRLWQRRFGGDRAVVGRVVQLDRVPTTIVGVLPQDFELVGYDTEFVAPLCVTRAQVESRVGGLTIVGRLKPGVSVAQAQAEVDAVTRGLAASDPERHAGLTRIVEPLQTAAYGAYASPLLLLQAAVAFVMLIACANVAGLLLARTAGRRGEIATRMTLGATRWRIARQLLAEGVPLAVLGGALGLLLGFLGLLAFAELAPEGFPRVNELSLGGATVAFTVLIAVGATSCSVAAAAVHAARVALAGAIGGTARGATEGHGFRRFRGVMVGGQVALAFVLLAGAGLMIASFARAMDNDLGADPDGLLVFDFRLSQAETMSPVGRYRGVGLWDVSPLPAQRIEEVLERLEALPEVEAVAAVSTPPLTPGLPVPFVVEGQAAAEPSARAGGESEQRADYRAVTRGYFETMSIPLVRGRDFDRFDRSASRLVAIVNEAFVRQYFPGGDALGKQVTLDLVPGERPREIVAIVGDTLDGPMRRGAEPAIYVPHVQQSAQWPGPYWPIRAGMLFVVRTAGAPLDALTAVRRAVADAAPGIPVANATSVAQTLAGQMADLRAYVRLLAAFGLLACVLTATGVYGVTAYTVARRTRELGIRAALGCTAWSAVLAVLRPMALVVLTGLAFGTAGALALAHALRSVLFEVGPADPATYFSVGALLGLVALAACAVPALRALRIDPAVVLKHE